MARLKWRFALLAIVAGMLGGCGWLGSSRDPNPQVYGLHDRVPEGGGRYKIGEPYVANGQRFYPREDPSYDETGVASWYGEYFHGRKTANGEWYDMNRLSAAHPTLPLPVYARVTNLENGRSLVVRINDRGPFKRGRIIDLSKGAARELGVIGNGTAPVRVTYISRAPLEGDVAGMQTVDRGTSWLMPGGTAALPGAQEGGRAAEPVPHSAPASDAPERTGALARPRAETDAGTEADGAPQPIIPPGFYIQAASFASRERAMSLAGELSHLGSFNVLPAEVAGETYYRVRLGPFESAGEAEGHLGALSASGYPDARVLGR